MTLHVVPFTPVRRAVITNKTLGAMNRNYTSGLHVGLIRMRRSHIVHVMLPVFRLTIFRYPSVMSDERRRFNIGDITAWSEQQCDAQTSQDRTRRLEYCGFLCGIIGTYDPCITCLARCGSKGQLSL